MDQLKKLVVNLDGKLDDISQTLTEIKVVQAEQAKDLQYHIRRSDSNEEMLEIVRAEGKKNTKFREKAEFTFRLIGIAASGLGLLFAGMKALESIIS